MATKRQLRADLAEALAYYTSELHRAAFAVPPYVRAAIDGPA